MGEIIPMYEIYTSIRAHLKGTKSHSFVQSMKVSRSCAAVRNHHPNQPSKGKSLPSKSLDPPMERCLNLYIRGV